MMAKRAKADPELNYDEYLALEERSEGKHEYVRGQVFAMAGGTPEHSALAAATIAALSAALRGKPCRVYTGDLRVRVLETDLATYPDVAVVCGKLETAKDDRHAATNPVLLVEVLSESTERHDRGAKFAHYRHIASLREYVLVDQGERRIEVYRRNPSGRFELFEFASGEILELISIAANIPVDEIYANPLAIS